MWLMPPWGPPWRWALGAESLNNASVTGGRAQEEGGKEVRQEEQPVWLHLGPQLGWNVPYRSPEFTPMSRERSECVCVCVT